MPQPSPPTITIVREFQIENEHESFDLSKDLPSGNRWELIYHHKELLPYDPIKDCHSYRTARVTATYQGQAYTGDRDRFLHTHSPKPAPSTNSPSKLPYKLK